MIRQWASRICPHALMLAFIFEETKLSLCFPVFLYWVTLCYMIWSKTIQCKETHVPSHWKYEDCSFLLPCGEESRSCVQKYCKKFSVIITYFLPQKWYKIMKQEQHWFLHKEKTVSWSFLLMILWKSIDIIARPHSYFNTILESQGEKIHFLRSPPKK